MLLCLFLWNVCGQQFVPPVISVGCSAINVTALSEIVKTAMNPPPESESPCSCGGPGWTRAMYLNMSDPSQSCPSNWTLVSSPIRGCGRSSMNFGECDSVYFSVGSNYSRICGRIVAYQKGWAAGFHNAISYNLKSIDSAYLDGISLTHGRPGSRQHIWSFIGAYYEQDPSYRTDVTCPCTNPAVSWSHTIPSFINNNYFCDTANSGPGASSTKYYTDDPLWDGQGCGGSSTCCEFNTPPWFCTSLPQPTNDNLEIRSCYGDSSEEEDKIITLVEIYVKV